MSSYFSMSIYRRKQVRNLTNLHGSGNVRFCHMAAETTQRDCYERRADIHGRCPCITQPPPDVLTADRGLRTILSINKWGLTKLFDRELLPILFKYDRF